MITLPSLIPFYLEGNTNLKERKPSVESKLSNTMFQKCIQLRLDAAMSILAGLKSSVIRQKGESQNGCFKKAKHVKFSKKRTFLTPWYAHLRVRNVCFSAWKYGVLCFLETPVLRYALLSYYRRNDIDG